MEYGLTGANELAGPRPMWTQIDGDSSAAAMGAPGIACSALGRPAMQSVSGAPRMVAMVGLQRNACRAGVVGPRTWSRLACGALC